MRSPRPAALIAAVVLVGAVACGPGDGPPTIALDRTACSHCGMLVSDRRTSAGLRLPGQEAMVFDDIGCLLSALGELPGAGDAQVWVRDADGDAWLNASEAVFTRGEPSRTPMGSGLLAHDRTGPRAVDEPVFDFEAILSQRNNDAQGDR